MAYIPEEEEKKVESDNDDELPYDTSEFPERKIGRSREVDVAQKLAGFKTRKAKKNKNVKRNKHERYFKRAASIQPDIPDSMMRLSSVQKG